MNRSQCTLLGMTILGCMLSLVPLQAATYRLDYDVKSDTRKNYIVKEIRMYYHASASAIFSGAENSGGGMAFSLADIPATGTRVRTHRNGEKLSIVTAGKNLALARAPFAALERAFKTGVAYYGPMVRTVDVRPFVIGSTAPGAFRFTRTAAGVYQGVSVNMPMITPAGYGPYGDSFNVYPIMGEVIKLYSHDALPAGGISAVIAGTVTRWSSGNINLTSVLNSLLTFADHKAREYVTFEQERGFRVQYRVGEKTATTVSVVGQAWPNVEIASGISIRGVTRTVTYRTADKALLSDVLVINARNNNGTGWYFTANLRRI